MTMKSLTVCHRWKLRAINNWIVSSLPSLLMWKDSINDLCVKMSFLLWKLLKQFLPLRNRINNLQKLWRVFTRCSFNIIFPEKFFRRLSSDERFSELINYLLYCVPLLCCFSFILRFTGFGSFCSAAFSSRIDFPGVVSNFSTTETNKKNLITKAKN